MNGVHRYTIVRTTDLMTMFFRKQKIMLLMCTVLSEAIIGMRTSLSKEAPIPKFNPALRNPEKHTHTKIKCT